MDGDVVLGCFGGVLKTFFVTVASKCLSLFQCYNHPNGRLSMRASPEVLQGSEEWSSILVHSLGGSLPVEGDPTLAAPIFKGATGATLSPRSSDMLCFPTMFIFGWTLPKPIVCWHWKAPRMMFFFVKIVRRSLYFSKKLFASKIYLPKFHPTSLVIFFFKFQVWWSLRRWPSSWIASCYWWSSPGPCGWHHDNSTWRVSACDGNLWSKRWDHQCTGGWWPFSSRLEFFLQKCSKNNSSGRKINWQKTPCLESDWGNSDICLHCLWAP